MAPAYPSTRTGTAQDLLRVVTRAYELELQRKGIVLPEKSEAARRWVEPLFRGLGVAFAKAMEAVPADWTVAFHDRLFKFLSKPRSYPFDPRNPRVVEARALAGDLERRTGRRPALLALISHPPVLGDLAHLNFELVRHATLALREARGRPCRPRLVVAIDPFALDTTSIAEEGLYAGYMGTFHLGIDRLALGRGHPGPSLTPLAAWAAMPMRLLRCLSEGGEIGLVPAGGVPSTSRVLYGVRDWSRAARERSPLRARPADVEKALRADPAFARFERSAASAVPAAAAEGRPWRLIDAWLMMAAAGLLSDETAEAAALSVLACLAVPPAERPGLLAELARDLSRETPRRLRLFRLLAGRVARRRPLVMIPIAHGVDPLGVSIGEAWSWEWTGPGRVTARRAGDPRTALETTPEAFGDRYIQENFK
ncbi:MAG TPA: hypothetical protein VN915_05205 [Elusimicrobiota bacterium]|nr:hypothetical protein [Elusimicrobiota bacterium]